MADRIAQAFARARARQRACFIAYMCAGDPDYETSLEVARTLLRRGVDILELGVPFSDPLADGLANQLAAERALAAGMTQARVFEIVKTLRAEFPQAPVVFYTYYNLVYAMGEENYAQAAQAAGLDGLLTLDLPPEEASGLIKACRDVGLHTIFLAAPTTPAARIQRIAEAATGFIYYVSREGVTGVRDTLADNIDTAVARIRQHTDVPVAVGFGISRGDQVRKVGEMADGVVVGSALVNCIAEAEGDRDAMLQKLNTKLDDLLSGLLPIAS